MLATSGCRTDVVKSGRYDEQLLVRLHSQHQADGVIFSRLNRFNAYPPMSADVIAHLVDTRDAAVVASIDGSWNLGDAGDTRRYQAFIDSGQLLGRGLEAEGRAVAELSPAMLAKFIASEIAANF